MPEDRELADEQLVEACLRFDALERRKHQVLSSGDGDDPRLRKRLAQLTREQGWHLRRIHGAQATTIKGHRARASSFLLRDAGDLGLRAGHGASAEDLILHALIRDLVGQQDTSEQLTCP